MEEFEVVGVDTRAYRTIQSEGGKRVNGVAWMLLGDAPEDAEPGRYLGQYVREQFISNERLAKLGVQPMPGDQIVIIYNRWGDITKVEISGKPSAKPYGSV